MRAGTLGTLAVLMAVAACGPHQGPRGPEDACAAARGPAGVSVGLGVGTRIGTTSVGTETVIRPCVDARLGVSVGIR